MRYNSFCIGMLLLSLLLPVPSWADDTFLDESFLDDTFTEEGEDRSSEPISDIEAEAPENAIETSYTAGIPEAKLNMGMSVENVFTFAPAKNSTHLNRNELQYVSPISNNVLFHMFLNYRNADRWFGINLDHRLFFQLKDRKEKETAWDLDSFRGWELNEANIVFTVADTFELKAGKVLFSSGSAYLINPSNPLVNRIARYHSWARALEIPNFSTDVPFENFDFPRGSAGDIGAWMLSMNLDLPKFYLQTAYLPELKTGYREFDRAQHSFLAKLSYTQWYSVLPSLIFFYDSAPFLGAELSLGIGEDITLHSELALSFENELRRIQQAEKNIVLSELAQEDIYNYSIAAESEEGLYFEGIIGISYTFNYESRSLFTLQFETYYNGKGLTNAEWESYLYELDAMHKDRNVLEKRSEAGLAALYAAMAGTGMNLYEPLKMRPLYLLLRISRDDLFSAFLAEKFNVDTSLVYSPFDTSFSWSASFEWEAKSISSVGAALNYNFGLDGGAFTELDNAFIISIYAKLTF